MIPDGDREINPNVNLPPLHVNVTVTNQMLRLIVSFRWHSLLDGKFTQDISQWIQDPTVTSSNPDAQYPPSFILIGNFLKKPPLISSSNNIIFF